MFIVDTNIVIKYKYFNFEKYWNYNACTKLIWRHVAIYVLGAAVDFRFLLN